MAIADKITKANNGVWASPATITGSKNIADTTVGLSVTTGWPVDATDGPVHVKLFKVDTDNNLIEGTASDHKATLAGTTLSNMIKTGGPDVDYETGDPCIIYPTAGFWNDIYDALVQSLNKDGTLKTAAVQQALGITSLPPPDWTVLPVAPSSVANNGQRSYAITYPGVDYTDRLQPGTRLRTTRTVAAPTQSTQLNGSTQYWSKSSPSKLTFLDDFAISAWVKITASQNETVISRFDGNNGWQLSVSNVGQVILAGYAGSGGANYSQVISRQSIPLNRWVHIGAQLDMSAFSASATNSYIMIDFVDVPVEVQRGGTNPTALVQAGDLNIGRLAGLGSQYFAGNIAQVAVFNAKVAQATMRGYGSQGYSGSETNFATGFSFNGVATDLNTTNPNDLVSSGGATATNADSPFGVQANKSVSSTLDYAIIEKVSFSTDTTVTIQVPEGCTVPTTGGVNSTSYSNLKAPFGFPSQRGRWFIEAISRTTEPIGIPGGNQWTVASGGKLTVPVGEWVFSYQGTYRLSSTIAGNRSGFITMGSSAPVNGVTNQDLTSRILNTVNNVAQDATLSKSVTMALDAATVFNTYAAIDQVSGSESYQINAGQGALIIRAENAYL